jgi:hypothetical protein
MDGKLAWPQKASSTSSVRYVETHCRPLEVSAAKTATQTRHGGCCCACECVLLVLVATASFSAPQELVPFDDQVHLDFVDLLKGLLEYDPDKYAGCGPNNACILGGHCSGHAPLHRR